MFKQLIAGKNKLIMIMLIGVLALSGGAVFFGKMYIDSQTAEFSKNGHIIIANEQAESTVHSFNSGTKYVKKLGGAYSFQDNDNNEIEIPNESFVFFDDNSISSLTKSVILDLADTENNQFINHYLIPANMQISTTAKGFAIENAEDTINIEEGLWKISDKKYMVLSNNLSVDFGNNDVRQVKQYAQIHYIEEGVVQIITDENVWQTVSSSLTITTDKGAILHLFDQYVEYNGVKMTFSKLVIDANDNIELSPLETRKQTVPEFNITGQNGASGADGAQGQNGSTGKGGYSGTDGNSGNNGDDGEIGNDGEDGEAGKDGETGEDVIFESTTKTDLPQITLTQFDVNATSLTAQYSVTDKNEMMSTDDYLKIKVYEAGSGEAIDCVTTDGISEDFTGYGVVGFKTKDLLKPDTEYRLVISGQYLMNGEKYEREFLSRVFYTDSLGVSILRESVTTNGINVLLRRKDYSTATSATVYLLTEDQAKENFDPTDPTKNYVSKTVSFRTRSSDDIEVNFTGLPVNKKYVVRLVVNVNGIATPYISQQALSLSTLKRTPTLSGSPTVANNRASWGFELYGGTVSDPDNAIISYQYEVYSVGSSSNQPIKVIDVVPSQTSKAVMLYIDNKVIYPSNSGSLYQYYYVIKAKYSDNEKIVELKSSQSPTFSMMGSQLPAMYYEDVSYQDANGNTISAPTKDRFEGRITIVSNGSEITATADNPLRIDIECEGVYLKTISYNSIGNSSNGSGAYYSGGGSDNRNVIIPVSCAGLSEGKTYRLTVSGLVNTYDSTGVASYQSIGHAVVKTPEIATLQARWTNTTNTTKVISKYLSLTSTTSATTSEFATTNDAMTMSSVVVQLLDANTMGIVGEKTFKATRQQGNDDYYFNSTLVGDLVTNEYEITEDTFGINQENLTSSSYVLRLKSAYDYTEDYFTLNPDSSVTTNGYVNEYSIDSTTRDVQIFRTLQPPTLPITNLDEQINAVKITNDQSSKYGKAQDDDLDDNTIVGYQLELEYNNTARLARKIYIYVFDSDTINDSGSKASLIYNSDNNTLLSDSTTDKKFISRYEIDVQANSYSMPRIAVMFGDGMKTSLENGKTWVVYDNNLKRGHHYTFAYAVEYTTKNEEGVDLYTTNYYPYNHPNFTSMSDQGNYLLRSKSQDTPKQEPKLYSYITNENQVGDNRVIEFKYMFTDVDQTLTLDANNNPDVKIWDQSLTSVTKSGDWYTSSVNYVSGKKTLDLYVEAHLYSDTNNLEIKKTKQSIMLDSISTPSQFTDAMIPSDTNTNPFKITWYQDKLSKNLLVANIENIPDALLNKIVVVKLEFYNKNKPTEIMSLNQGIAINGNAATMTVSAVTLRKLVNRIGNYISGNSGDQYGPICVKTSVMFDTGYQGWDLVNTSNTDGYILQMISGGMKYVGYDNTTQSVVERDSARGSLFITSVLGDMNQLSPKSSVTFNYYPLFGGTNYMMPSALSMTNGGILVSSTTNSADKKVLVAKKTDKMPLGCGMKDSNDNLVYEKELDQLTSITPSASNGDYVGNTTSIQVKDFSISGIGNVNDDSVIDPGDKNVHFELTPKGGTTSTVDVPIDSHWNYIDADDTYKISELVFKNLYTNTEYTITAYVNILDNSVSTRKDLIAYSQNTGEETRNWQIKVKTAQYVEVSNGSIKLINDIYSKKQLSVSFDLSQTIDISLKYQILKKDEAGAYSVIYDFAAMTAHDMTSSLKNSNNYTMKMNDLIDLKVGQHSELTPGEIYYVQVMVYDKDGNNRVDNSTTPIYIPFTLPIPTEPIVFSDMWVEYVQNGEREDMMLKYNFSVTDPNKVIMTDYLNTTDPNVTNVQVYYAVLYKAVENNGTTQYEVVQDSQGNKKIYICTPGVMNADAISATTNEKYIMKFYATIDRDHDGKADIENVNIQTAINDQLFHDYGDQLMFFEKAPYLTPSENGISLGTQTLIPTATDSTKITIRYQNATKLEDIKIVEYTIIDALGTHYSETITNPLFRSGGSGFFTLDLPTGLMNTGIHQVTVDYYVFDANNVKEKVGDTYSDTYLYQ